MLAQETVSRRIEVLGRIDLTRSLWWWLNKKFEGIGSRLQKADLLKSALALALLAQLISIVQKELPEDSQIRDLLNHYDQDGYQANLVVRREKPWKAIRQNCTGPLEETQYGFFKTSLLVGPKPQADEDPRLAFLEIHIPYPKSIERWGGGFESPRLTIAMVTKADQKYINRLVTEDELRLMAGIVKSVALEEI